MVEYEPKSPDRSFIKAKGFYIALALCITGAGTAAWLTAQNTISGIREQQQKPPAVTEQGEGNQWDYEDILQQQTGGEANTPKPSLPTSPSTAPENPSPTQSAAADAPQPPAKSEPAAPLCFCLPVQGALRPSPLQRWRAGQKPHPKCLAHPRWHRPGCGKRRRRHRR